jgi:hypothetical protein
MKKPCALLLFLYLFVPLAAQTDDFCRPNSINEGTLIGIGGYHIKNTYLSPVYYSGTGIFYSPASIIFACHVHIFFNILQTIYSRRVAGNWPCG